MDNLFHVRLRALNPDLKHDRGYQIILGKDLFGTWYVTTTFGRYGTGGTSKTRLFEERRDSSDFINATLKRRLSSPKRIGCSYQIVSFDGAEEILETINRKVIEKFSWFENKGTNRNTSTP